MSGESGFGQTGAGLAIAHQAAADDKLETSHPSADPDSVNLTSMDHDDSVMNKFTKHGRCDA